MNQNKLRLCAYFDKLINGLDLKVEHSILENNRDECYVAAINKKRDEFINEIRHVEAYNLRALSDNTDMKQGEVLSDEELFPKFCFFTRVDFRNEKALFNYDSCVSEDIGLILFVTYRYLSQGQIRCFETSVSILSAWDQLSKTWYRFQFVVRWKSRGKFLFKQYS
jgi:hypothetical protein